MLSDNIKQTIQSAYSEYIKRKAFRPRYGQRLMIAEIAKVMAGIETDAEGQRISSNHACAIEAGTGTGKTVAYLLPVIPVAVASNKKIVVATATVALQDQLINKDIPDLLDNSSLEFSYALAKGRGRYVCLSHLDQLVSPGSTETANLPLWEDLAVDEESVRLYKEMNEAIIAGGWNGERDCWHTDVDEPRWRRVANDHHRCTGRHCDFYEDCYFYRAREAVYKADVIVANHDLVLADLALGGGAALTPPEDTIYIFDEGHHLPEKALSHFSSCSYLHGSRGWLDELVAQLGTCASSLDTALIFSGTETLLPLIEELKGQIGLLYSTLQPLAEKSETVTGDNGRRLYRFNRGVVPESLREQCEDLRQISSSIMESMNIVTGLLSEAMEGKHSEIGREEGERWYPQIAMHQNRIQGMVMLWRCYSRNDGAASAPLARWLGFSEIGGELEIEVAASPVLAADVLTRELWSRCYGAVVTSATLSAMGCFDRFIMHSGIPQASVFLTVPSPFSFEQNGELVIPAMAFDPTDRSRHTGVIVSHLLSMEKGQTVLALFTSRWQLEEVLDAFPADLAERVLCQGHDSKQEIIKRHKQKVDRGEGSIILGLASFAEGVDLPGKYCTHVLISKIPFAVPEDPVEATLAEWVREQGGNPFMDITVPDAAIRLKQAVGRLLRSETDAGTVTILDRRLLTRPYGKAILDSLPPFKKVIGK